jgi:glycosyltransferase involved in cell wall biosynthesis
MTDINQTPAVDGMCHGITSNATRVTGYVSDHLIPSIGVGGAERIVADLANWSSLTHRDRVIQGVNLYSYEHREFELVIEKRDTSRLFFVEELNSRRRLDEVASYHWYSGSPVLYCHLIREEHLKLLWERGIKTVPVVHNARENWKFDPASLEPDHVPFLVAVSMNTAKQLREAKCSVPIHVIRHTAHNPSDPDGFAAIRSKIRDSLGVSKNTIVVGMVGSYKPQKNYMKALAIFAQLQLIMDAKLVIVGSASSDEQLAEEAAVLNRIQTLGLGRKVVRVPQVLNPLPYYAAFDVFLNTSHFEGLSIATLEARSTGCPIVTARVGGQSEAVATGDQVLPASSPSELWTKAITQASQRPRPTGISSRGDDRKIVGMLWHWAGAYHEAKNAHLAEDKVLFVTSTLNPGGAQRSLVNLTTVLPNPKKLALIVLGEIPANPFCKQLRQRGIRLLSMSPEETSIRRYDNFLHAVHRSDARTVCFWNADAKHKLLLVKILRHSRRRFVDVSPGPHFFGEMEHANNFGKTIAFSSKEYFRRLDVFVSKYTGGTIPAEFGTAKRTTVIPNGVQRSAGLAASDILLRKEGTDPRFAVVTCGRITPDKHVIEMLEMLAHLKRRVPGASLTFIGGPDKRATGEYLERVQEKIRSLKLANAVHFAGEHASGSQYFHQFAVFALLSSYQGCPNALLEAMMAAMPVVANDDGGTSEQVIHGQTGYLVKGVDPLQMANYVEKILRNPQRASRMGTQGSRIAKERFSMAQMVEAYSEVFWPMSKEATW